MSKLTSDEPVMVATAEKPLPNESDDPGEIIEKRGSTEQSPSDSEEEEYKGLDLKGVKLVLLTVSLMFGMFMVALDNLIIGKLYSYCFDTLSTCHIGM
jgi:hypothetical protein